MTQDSSSEFRTVARALSVVATPFIRFDLPAPHDQPHLSPVIWCPNHRSMFDAVIGLVAFYRIEQHASLMVNARYFDWRLVGRLLKKVNAIPVDLQEGALTALGEATDRLRSGESIVIMAEGGVIAPEDRNEMGIGPLQAGVTLIARRSGVPIIATGIAGSEHVLPLDRKYPKISWGSRHIVTIRFAKPFQVTGKPRAALDELSTILGDIVATAEADRALALTR